MAQVIDDYKKNFNTTVVGASVTVISQVVVRTNYSQNYYPSSRIFEFNNRPVWGENFNSFQTPLVIITPTVRTLLTVTNNTILLTGNNIRRARFPVNVSVNSTSTKLFVTGTNAVRIPVNMLPGGIANVNTFTSISLQPNIYQVTSYSTGTWVFAIEHLSSTQTSGLSVNSIITANTSSGNTGNFGTGNTAYVYAINNNQIIVFATSGTIAPINGTIDGITITGGTVSSQIDFTIHTFLSTNNLVVTSSITSATTLIVGGGGGGGTDMGGGGGAGGYLAANSVSLGIGTFVATVGSGGTGAPQTATNASARGSNGDNSAFNGSTAIGGGGGASNHSNTISNAGNGGSGGGGSGGRMSSGSYGGLAGTGTVGQGNNGAGSGVTWYPGGGGGAGAAASQTGSQVGHGGAGVSNSILGTAYFWAGGGGGAGYSNYGGDGGAGGGGGGAPRGGSTGLGNTQGINPGLDATVGSLNAQTNVPGGNAGINTGGGGGGGSHYVGNNQGGNGGSGIIIVRYAGGPKATGGTITTIPPVILPTFRDPTPPRWEFTVTNLSTTIGYNINDVISSIPRTGRLGNENSLVYITNISTATNSISGLSYGTTAPVLGDINAVYPTGQIFNGTIFTTPNSSPSKNQSIGGGSFVYPSSNINSIPLVLLQNTSPKIVVVLVGDLRRVVKEKQKIKQDTYVSVPYNTQIQVNGTPVYNSSTRASIKAFIQVPIDLTGSTDYKTAPSVTTVFPPVNTGTYIYKPFAISTSSWAFRIYNISSGTVSSLTTGSIITANTSSGQTGNFGVGNVVSVNTITSATSIIAFATGGTSAPIPGPINSINITGGVYTATTAAAGTSLTISYLIVAGGGSGGGGQDGGGGGGGGLLASSVTISSGDTTTITVGLGGAAIAANAGVNGLGNNGLNSSIVSGSVSRIAIGGGGGGSHMGVNAGNTGGSGGGAGNYNAVIAGGLGTTGQGYAGAPSYTPSTNGGGGGGGAGAAATTHNGGNGLSNSLSGSAVTYAGGGGGGGTSSYSGGTGGGGTGGGGSTAGTAGTNGLGGGGGGGGDQSNGAHPASGAGGSGIVIISYPTGSVSTATGGTTSTVSTSTVHTFLSNGVFSYVAVPSTITVDLLVVGGGGGGGASTSNNGGAGGGAGGYRSFVGLAAQGNYTITVASGGRGARNTGATDSENGGVSSAFGYSAAGGGRAGSDTGSQTGGDGGSGGGAGGSGTTSVGNGNTPSTSPSQGNAGGQGGTGGGGNQGPGGGGGAGAVGANRSGGTAGAGGAGSTWLNGSTYAGGGGGGASNGGGGAAGGTGGGGTGAQVGTLTAGDGGGGTGGGGGGAAQNYSTNSNIGGNGGGGVVIIRYPGSTSATGGTITTVGTYTVHTFVSSGVFTAGSAAASSSFNSSSVSEDLGSRGLQSAFVSKVAIYSSTITDYNVGTLTNIASLTGDVGPGLITSVSGTGPWTIQINQLRSTIQFTTSTLVYATPLGGSFGVGNIVAVSAVNSSTSITCIARNGTVAPTTGTIVGVYSQGPDPGTYIGPVTGVSTLTNTSSYSVIFNGTTSFLQIAHSTNFNLNSLAWTVECWLRPDGFYPIYSTIFCKRVTGSGTTSYEGYLRLSTGVISFYNGTNYESSYTLTPNVWSHCAWVYTGSKLNIYVNGSVVYSVDVSLGADNGEPLIIGNARGYSEYFSGYISNFRMVKGIVVYTGTFTPPNAPLQTTQSTSTNISPISTGTYTVLLTCQNTTIIDRSSYNNVITQTASVVSLVSPLTTATIVAPFTFTIFGLASTNAFVNGSIITATSGTGNLGTGTVYVYSVNNGEQISCQSTASVTAGTISNVVTATGNYYVLGSSGPAPNYAPITASLNFNGFGAKLGPAATVLITSANAPEISTATTIKRFNSIFINSSLSITGNETTQPIQIYTRDATVNYGKTQWIIPEPMNQIRGQPITTSTVVIGAVVTSTYVRSTATGSINAFRITPTTLIKNNYIPVTIDGGSHTDSYKTAVAINRMPYPESIGIDRLDTLVIVNTINTATTKVRIFANQRTSINQSKSVTDSLTGSTDFYVIGTGTGTISSGTTITRYWV